MFVIIDFWKLKTKNSLLHVFNFLHKLSFENNFYFLSILGCQISFLIFKIKNCFGKQKIMEKSSYQIFSKCLIKLVIISGFGVGDCGTFSHNWNFCGYFYESRNNKASCRCIDLPSVFWGHGTWWMHRSGNITIRVHITYLLFSKL